MCIIIAIIIVSIVIAVVIWCQIAVLRAAWGRLYSDVDKIPHREVGLLLGTNPIGRNGNPNQFFLRRIDAAAALYKHGKIDRFILSGTKRETTSLDEPEAMRKALLEQGVPDNILTLDGQGFRTINSLLKAKEVYQVDSCTIISQRFHNERTLFLASRIGIDAIAYNSINTQSLKWKVRMIGRESLSRVKAFFEVRKYKPRK